MGISKKERAKRNAIAVAIAVVATIVAGPVAGKMAGKIASGIGTALGFTGTTAALVGSFVIRATLGLAYVAMNSQTPKIPARGYNVTQKGSALDRQIIYGETRAAGVIVFDGTTGSSNKYLHRVIAFTTHEIEEFKEIWLDNYKLTVNLSTGAVTSAVQLKADTDPNSSTYRQMIPDTSTTTTRYNSYVRIKGHVGTDTQVADSDLTSEVTEWTSAHQLKGISYLYIRLKYDGEVFPNGLPEIQATIKGKKVYDPRKDSTSSEYDSSLGVSSHRTSSSSTWEYSNNPALCIRDYLTYSDYGLGENHQYIDDASVHSAADHCDTTASDGSKFFTLNGSFTTGSQPIDVISQLLTSMNGLLWYSQGKWRMRSSEWTAPTLTLDEDDLRSELSVSTRHSARDNFNIIRGTWRGADSNWQVTDFPEYKVNQAITDDGGIENVLSMDLGFTTSVNEAQRLARISYERNREQLTVTATFGMNALKCQIGDFIQFNYDRMGWDNSTPKYWEVVEWSFGVTDYVPVVNMTLREASSTTFDEISQYEVYEKNNTTLASPFDTEAIWYINPQATSSISSDGKVIPKLKWSWLVTDTSDVDYYIFGWRIGSSGTYNEFIVKDAQFELEPAVAGATYYYRIRAVNRLGVSASGYTSSITAVGDTTAPPTPVDGTTNGSDPTITAGFGQIEVSWETYNEPSDFAVMEVHHSTSSGGTYTRVGATNGTSFIHAGLADGSTHYYKIRAKDLSGNLSSFSPVVSGTTSSGVTGPVSVVYTIEYDDLKTAASPLISGAGEYKIQTGTGGDSGDAGESSWTTNITKIYLYTTDRTDDDKVRYYQSLKAGDFITVTYNNISGASAVFKLSTAPVLDTTPTGISNVWRLTGTTESVTGTLSNLTTSGYVAEFGFSRGDESIGTQVNSGLSVPIDNNPENNNATSYVSATASASPTNLTSAFLAFNPQITDMGQIPDRTRIWARFYYDTGTTVYESYRVWQPTTQNWSDHATDIADGLVYIDELISPSVITNNLDVIQLDVDQVNINSQVEFADGAAWQVGDKDSPFETTKNGLYFGNPTQADSDYAFAITGGVTTDANGNVITTNSHGALFSSTSTQLWNPIIKKGTQSISNTVTNSGPNPTTINHGIASQRVSTVTYNIAADVITLYINGIAGGGGGSGAQGSNTQSNRGGESSSYTLRHGTTVLATRTVAGGYAGTGTGTDKFRGDAGIASPFAAGGGGGGSGGNGGNGSLGSGAGGGGGRAPNWDTSSRRGGGEGGAGVHFSDTLDVSQLKIDNNIALSQSLTLETVAGTGGNYSGAVSYGDGGYGGAGFVNYQAESSGLVEVVLNTDEEHKAGTIGRYQSWQSITLAQNTWVANPDDQPVQVCVSQSVAGGGSSYFQIADDSNGTNAINITQKSDDNARELMAACIVPVGKYFRQTNHGSYIATILRT